MSNLVAYAKKPTPELLFIIQDAGEAARAMHGVSAVAEAKYLDQVNDASTILYQRAKVTRAPRQGSVG